LNIAGINGLLNQGVKCVSSLLSLLNVLLLHY